MVQAVVEERLRIIAGQIHSASEIGAWCFSMERELYYTTCFYEKEILTFFRLSGCLDYVYDQAAGLRKPILLSDSVDLLWVAEYVYKEDEPVFLIVMGPVFCVESSVKNIEESLRKMDFPISVRKQMMRILSDIPVITMSMLNQYSIMLHYTIYEEKISPRDLCHQNSVEEAMVLHEEERGVKKISGAEREILGEQILLQAVRDGNSDYRKILDDAADFGGTFSTSTGKPLRDAKNTVIIFTALCRRAAVEGGVSMAVAKTMEEDAFIRIEECDTITKLVNINLRTLNDFIEQVRKCKSNPGLSKEIQECCAYIKANILEPLTLGEVAAQAGYSEYYLTKKFRREMGIGLIAYIKHARIEYAKICLITTRKSIREISEQLHFGTRNYFSKIFRELVGMSPADYRERSERERVTEE